MGEAFVNEPEKMYCIAAHPIFFFSRNSRVIVVYSSILIQLQGQRMKAEVGTAPGERLTLVLDFEQDRIVTAGETFVMFYIMHNFIVDVL